MGKKSKNKAKAEARPVGPGGKLPRCAKCASFVRTNGQTCPGCTRIFCRRCSGHFGRCLRLDCPSPTMRCPDCLGGATVEKMMKRGDIPNDTLPPDGMIRETDVAFLLPPSTLATIMRVAPDAAPMSECGNEGCIHAVCQLCRGGLPSRDPMYTCKACRHESCRACVLSVSAFEERHDEGRRIRSDAFLRCTKCFICFCGDCGDSAGLRWHVTGRSGPDQMCTRCYWTTKPCTNPDCPNKAGVPTKRCGDCRRARYCSKECQIAMWPEHKLECSRLRAEKDEKLSEAKVRRVEAKNQGAPRYC
mmetsp:Transcript_241/g.530  ORF Transcript_241/g.530 Transcript_241/m.530 type:complete len:303 (+) Transcript_241:120-1028(+)